MLVLLLRGRGNQHVVYICVTEIKVSENLIDEPLKCLRGVSEQEGHTRDLEESEGIDDGVRFNWNLVVFFHQVDCTE